MIEYTEYRFVVARRTGLSEVGTGRYPRELHRGMVVRLDSAPVTHPGLDPVRVPRFLVEQVIHELRVKHPDPPGGLYNTPTPHAAGAVTVYVSPLDDGGFVIPYERGPIPGLDIVVYGGAVPVPSPVPSPPSGDDRGS